MGLLHWVGLSILALGLAGCYAGDGDDWGSSRYRQRGYERAPDPRVDCPPGTSDYHPHENPSGGCVRRRYIP